MVDDELRRELLAMRDEDLVVREELLKANQLGGPYHPRMETIHVKNAARLRELIAKHGWPCEDVVGADGAEAAWLIAQHAIGEPGFVRRVLQMVRAIVEQKRVPAWHAAYLEDRIALFEGRPQRYGSQWIDDPRDGLARPWTLAYPDRVNELRAEVGLKPLAPIPPPGPEVSVEVRQKIESDQQWWLDWLVSRGWRKS
jgi:hypothetical protein